MQLQFVINADDRDIIASVDIWHCSTASVMNFGIKVQGVVQNIKFGSKSDNSRPYFQ